MTAVSVVTVTHNSGHVLPAFFRALGDAPEGCEVVVVDSGSREPSAVRALAEERGARFVDAGANVGYGTGSNRGAAASSGRWLAFVNPDVEISWSSLVRLAGTAGREGLVAAGPQLEDAEGRDVVSGHAFMRPPWVRAERPRPAGGTVDPADVVSGCALVVDRRAFLAVGGFDERFFMFAEEHDLQRRLRDVGGVVGVVRDVRARTVGGASSDSVSGRWSAAERSVGHIRYMHKHFGPVAGVVDLVYRCALAVLRPEQRPARASLAQILRARPLGRPRPAPARRGSGGGSRPSGPPVTTT